MTGSSLERDTQKGDSPVQEIEKDDGEYPEYNSSNFELEYGTHLVLTLNTTKVR